MYPTNAGTGGRVLGAGHLAAASLGIGLPIATAVVLIAALFSPALWTSVPLVMLAVFVANLANLLAFIGLHRARAGPEPFRSALGVGACSPEFASQRCWFWPAGSQGSGHRTVFR